MKSIVLATMFATSAFAQMNTQTDLNTDVPKFAAMFAVSQIASPSGLAPAAENILIEFNPLNMTLLTTEGGKRRVERVYRAKSWGFGHSAIPFWEIALAYETIHIEFVERRKLSAKIYGDNQNPIFYFDGHFLAEPDSDYLSSNLKLLEKMQMQKNAPPAPKPTEAPSPVSPEAPSPVSLEDEYEQLLDRIILGLTAEKGLAPQYPPDRFLDLDAAQEDARNLKSRIANALKK